MAGGIKFKEGVFWGKAAWLYRNARDSICDTLREMPDGSALADELSAESHSAQWLQHFNIEGWPKEKKKLFFQAIYRTADRVAKEGPVGWRDPAFFPGYLRAMEELVQMARDMEGEDADA